MVWYMADNFAFLGGVGEVGHSCIIPGVLFLILDQRRKYPWWNQEMLKYALAMRRLM